MRFELFLVFQYLVFILNIFLIVAVLNDNKYNHKAVRVVLLLASCVFMLSSINEITWVTVAFSFAPFLALIQFEPNGKISKFIKGSGYSGGSNTKSIQSLQDRNKTVSRQKA